MLAKIQYIDLLQSACVIQQEKFSISDNLPDPVEKFSKKGKSYSDLRTIYIFSFELAHSQSQAEPGFNINEAMLVENIEETSIKDRLLYDDMASKSVTIHEFIIPKELTFDGDIAGRYLFFCWI